MSKLITTERRPRKAKPSLDAAGQNSWYAALVQAYPGYALVLDSTGSIEFANRHEPLLPAEGIVGKDVATWLGADAGAARAALARVLESGEEAQHEFRADLADGSTRWYLAQLTRVVLPCQGLKLLVFIADVTERRATEDALRQTLRDFEESKRQMMQGQKMESIGRLAGGIAHDFNNLLTAIISFARFVMDDLAPGDPRRRDLAEVLKAADSASRLTSQLLAFSRKRPVEPQLLDLNESIRLISRVLRRTIEETVELRIIESQEPSHVMCDPGQFDQLVMNLAVNARDAMPEGGTVTFEIGRRHIEGHRDLASGDYATLTVVDTGTGMTEEVLGQIFEPFFSTKGENGTGLGLATCYGIAKQAQGHIEVTSRAQHGAAFTVLLPLAKPPLECGNKETMAAVPPCKLSGLALVVEDQAPIRRTMTRSLQAMGLNVIEAGTAEEALAVVEDLGAKVDLLVTDVVLPGLSGIKLAERLRAQQPGIRILVCSGYMGYAQDTGITVNETTAFLAKPFTGQELASKASILFQ